MPRRDHYSYTLYADPATARTFDTPVRRADRRADRHEQAAVLADFIGRVQGRTILDVGTGTGRAALLWRAAEPG